MDKINLNFGMFIWTCKCGHFINYKSFEINDFRKYLEYAIKLNINTQYFNYAFYCKKCGKVECLRFFITRDKNCFIVRNGGKL